MWGKTFLETFSPLKPGTTFIMPFTKFHKDYEIRKCDQDHSTERAYRSLRRQTSVEPSLMIPNTSGIISPLKLNLSNQKMFSILLAQSFL